MKKMFAIATVAAMLGGSAFAADSEAFRLGDSQMDAVTAGSSGSGKNGSANAAAGPTIVIVPITNVELTQIALALGAGAGDTIATNNAVITITNNFFIVQNLGGNNGKHFKPYKMNNGKHYAYGRSNSGPGSYSGGKG